MTVARGRAPDYALMEDFTYKVGLWESKVMPAGTFLRPVELCYVPKHVVDDSRWSRYDKINDIFCYSSYGFIPIPRKLIRQV